jgi:hypothetical protein
MEKTMRKGMRALLALVLIGFGAGHVSALEYVFATPGEGRAILLGDRDYYARMSPAEIAIRIESTAADKTAADLEALYGENVLAFTEVEKAQYREVLAANWGRLKSVAALLPETVYFIKTTAKVEGGLPHTHANAIIVPDTAGPLTADLLFHETFHVLSRHEHARRASLYALVAFAPCAFDEPPKVAAIHLTNPDVPAEAFYVRVGEGVNVIPFLYAVRGAFDPELEGGFRGHFGFGLMEVTVAGGACRSDLDAEGNPVLLDPAQTPGYFEALGKNTGYIIHPEETLADNFAFLMLDKTGLPNPEILERLKGWLGLD